MLVASCGGSSAPTDYPYESCYAGDVCTDGFDCLASSLPGTTYAGYSCTSYCDSFTPCAQVPSGLTAACVNNQCYLDCTYAGTDYCPFDQACGRYYDQYSTEYDYCTP